MGFQPFKAIFSNRLAVRKQEQRTHRVLALEIEMRNRVNPAAEIDIERDIKSTMCG